MKYISTSAKNATPVHILKKSEYDPFVKTLGEVAKNWLLATKFKPATGAFTLVPESSGRIDCVIQIVEEINIYSLSHLPKALPNGVYKIATPIKIKELNALVLGWLLGCYSFDKYKKTSEEFASLFLAKTANFAEVKSLVEAIFTARDLINTPANDMLPDSLAAEAIKIAKPHKAKIKITVGEQLKKANYPLIYAVGKASAVAPRLVDFSWGNPKHPKVTLVGKGVCFDSGGLDIKPSSNMRLMKKDMGGAAVALALAKTIMEQKIPVRLRVLLPIVENAIAGNAMRPLDVIRSRKGISVEIGNTDAEGRLILCDALFEADREKPDLLIDFATLTGAARVALGTDLPALFTTDESLAKRLQEIGKTIADPLYAMPLHQTYREALNSKIADISNDPDSSYGGAITAALYLQEFVSNAKSYAHIDLMAWNLKDKAGRPSGGEAQTLRAIFEYIKEKYV